MANYVEKEGQETKDATESEMDEWLKYNNLQHLMATFKQRNLVLEEFMEYALEDEEDEFKQYLADLQIDKASIKRIWSKVKKLRKEKRGNGNIKDNKVKVVRIIISEEEEESMNKLKKYSENIASSLEQLSRLSANASTNEERYEAQIKREFSDLMDVIKNKQEMILNKLSNIYKRKQSEIKAKAQELQEEEESTKNTMKACNALVEDVNMDRVKRKNKIIANTKKAMKQPISADISTAVVFEFNTDSVASFVAHLAEVYGEEKHPIPRINDVECKCITQHSCTMRWSALLSKKDIKKQIKTKLWMKVETNNDNMDEKDKEQTGSSSLILFDRKKKDYQYTMNNLKRDTQYKMGISFYESHKGNRKKTIKRKDTKASSIEFKTIKYDIDRRFIYQSDFDTNGICYAMGTNFGTSGFNDPQRQGLIQVNASEWYHDDYRSGGKYGGILDRTTAGCYASNTANSWMSIDFGQKLKITPTAYTLKHWKHNNSFALKSWDFEGSNDGTNWTLLRKHQNETVFKKKGDTHTWTIENCNNQYRMFRIKSTGPDTGGDHHVCLGGFEMYGHLVGNR